MSLQDLELAQATTISFMYCDHCGYPHIILKDENGAPFAEAVISEVIAEALISDLKRFLLSSKEAGEGYHGPKH